MREVCIIGMGMTNFVKTTEKSLVELGVEAAWAAIKDAGVRPTEVEIAYCGTGRSGQIFHRESGVGQSILWEMGITGIPITRVASFCASGGSAVWECWKAISSGAYDIALAIGVEKLSVGGRAKGRPLTPDGVELLAALGMAPPMIFALMANRHMHEYGSTPKQIAMVAVKNRQNAGPNPRCQFRSPVTVEEVLASPMVADPLTLLSCCPTTDGGAAVVLCSKEKAARYTSRPVMIAASVLRSGIHIREKEATSFPSEVKCAKAAYETAGYGPEDMDFAEVHDCFTIAEIVHTEDLGFCAKGEGGRLVEEGATAVTGKIPINPSGGLMSRGHPIGATGVAQVCEAVLQLKGIAENQVKGAQIGLTHCAGGFQDMLELGDAASQIVNILKRGW